MQNYDELKQSIDSLTGALQGFQNWFNEYNQEKKNQQKFAIENFPARVFRKTISLSVAGALQVTGIPFNGAQVEKVYDATSGLSVDGSIKINFDRGMIDNIISYKKLVENDSFTLGFSTSNSFLSWDAQANVMCDIVFFNDIDYRSGSQKTSVSGTVSVANTNATSFYNKPSIPTATQKFQISATNTNIYTVAAGKYAVVKYAGLARSGGSYNISIGGTNVVYSSPNTNDAQFIGELKLLEGDVLGATVSGAASCGYLIEEYSV